MSRCGALTQLSYPCNGSETFTQNGPNRKESRPTWIKAEHSSLFARLGMLGAWVTPKGLLFNDRAGVKDHTRLGDSRLRGDDGVWGRPPCYYPNLLILRAPNAGSPRENRDPLSGWARSICTGAKGPNGFPPACPAHRGLRNKFIGHHGPP